LAFTLEEKKKRSLKSKEFSLSPPPVVVVMVVADLYRTHEAFFFFSEFTNPISSLNYRHFCPTFHPLSVMFSPFCTVKSH